MTPWLRMLGRTELTEMLVETPPSASSGKPVKGARDTEDARVAELRKRYKKVQNDEEPSGVSRKSETNQEWF